MSDILAVLAKSCQAFPRTADYSLLPLRILWVVDGEALKQARARLGISRDQLAGYSGVSRETLRKIEEQGYQPKSATIADIERGLQAASEEVGVMQRLQALEHQVQSLEALVRLLISARTEQPVAPPEKP